MWAVLDAVRDTVVSLALSWIGVFVEPAPQSAPAVGGDAPAACATSGKAGAPCPDRKPGFRTQTCAKDH